MVKDIVVNLSVTGKLNTARDYALSVASTLEAHVSAVAYRYEPYVPGMVFDSSVVSGVIEAQRVEYEKSAKQAIAGFEEAARRAAVSSDVRTIEASLAGAAEDFAAYARTFDLSIVGQPEPDDGVAADLIAEAALFGSGRPAVIVPYIQKAGLKLDHVTVCWDGGRPAARAVADALPFLRRSKTIEVLTVETEKSRSSEIRGADLAQHLARHRLKVELNSMPAADIDVGAAILSHVADTGSDFLVMGAYGHSRLREFVLGGATRGILDAMTLPVLMSH